MSAPLTDGELRGLDAFARMWRDRFADCDDVIRAVEELRADRRLLERCREVLTAETESVRAADLLDDLDARLGKKP